MNKKIFISPLNWGLGHASRCIPIIRLLEKSNTIILGGTGLSGQLLKKEFPYLEYVEVPGMEITYQQKNPTFHLLKQIPLFLKYIKLEHQWLNEFIKEKEIEVVISDHRYGIYHKEIPSYIIAHQIFIQGLDILNPLLNKKSLDLLKNFNEVWIPDYESENSLSGDLSHKKKLPSNFKFIGPLTRFESVHENTNYIIDLLCILSGPEPLRTELERKLILEFKNIKSKNIVLVRGTSKTIEFETSNCKVIDLADSHLLAELIHQSKLILARSGYSTIMDLHVLGKPAILIPTPGQYEQEYLAKFHKNTTQFKFVTEKTLTLNDTIFDLPKTLTNGYSFSNLSLYLKKIGLL